MWNLLKKDVMKVLEVAGILWKNPQRVLLKPWSARAVE